MIYLTHRQALDDFFLIHCSDFFPALDHKGSILARLYPNLWPKLNIGSNSLWELALAIRPDWNPLLASIDQSLSSQPLCNATGFPRLCIRNILTCFTYNEQSKGCRFKYLRAIKRPSLSGVMKRRLNGFTTPRNGWWHSWLACRSHSYKKWIHHFTNLLSFSTCSQKL